MHPTLLATLLALTFTQACAEARPCPDPPVAEHHSSHAEQAPPEFDAKAHAAHTQELNAKFLRPDLDVSKWRARFSSPGREVATRHDAIVAAMTLNAGEVIADVGAGTGLFLDAFLTAVGPEGKVLALELAPAFVADIAARYADDPRLTAVQTEASSTKLPTDSADVAFICDVWHHLDDPAAMAAELARIIRPGGRLVIVEFERLPGLVPEWQAAHVKQGRAEVLAMLAAQGFSSGRIVGDAGLSLNWMVELVNHKDATPAPH